MSIVLVGRRNALVHYKVRTSHARYGMVVPDFVERMGMRASELDNSLNTVRGMVTSLAKMEKRKPPPWMGNEWWGIFDF
jgi:hypothetical protein